MPYSIGLLEQGDGFILRALAGEAIPKKRVVYPAADGYWYQADADAAKTNVKGLSLENISKGKVGRILLWGIVGYASWSWTPGSLLYLSTTAGALSETPPDENAEVVARALSANYILFSPQGIPRSLQYLEGNENQWDDMPVTASNVRIPSVNGANYGEVGSTGLYLPRYEAGKDQSVRFTVQLSHRYEPGTPLHFHIHYVVEEGYPLAEIRWKLEYAIASIGDNFQTGDSGADLYHTPESGSLKHQLAETHIIPGTGLKESLCIFGNLTRLGTQDAFQGSAYLVSLDPHFKQNKLGTYVEFPT